MTKSRLIYCEDGAVGPCEKCGRKLLVLKYRGEFLCRACLYPDEEPLDLEDYMYAPSNFARAPAQAPGLHGWPTIHEVRERKERNRARMREWWSKNRGKGVDTVPPAKPYLSSDPIPDHVVRMVEDGTL